MVLFKSVKLATCNLNFAIHSPFLFLLSVTDAIVTLQVFSILMISANKFLRSKAETLRVVSKTLPCDSLS